MSHHVIVHQLETILHKSDITFYNFRCVGSNKLYQKKNLTFKSVL